MTTTLTPSVRSPLRGRARTRLHLVADRLDHAGAVAMAGGLAGLVALGLGSRVAMRVVALTSGRIGTGIRPESGATPGTVTLEGTTFLLLAGAMLGLAIGLAVVLGVGRGMPRSARGRWWVTAAIAVALPAIGLLDPANEDFRLFGPRWLAIGLFAVLPIAYGAMLATFVPRLRAWRGGRVARTARVGVGVLGLLATSTIVVGLSEEARGLLVLPLVVLLGLVRGPSRSSATEGPAAPIGRAAVAMLAVVGAGVLTWRVVGVVMA